MGKRKYRRSDSDDESKENRITKKMKRLSRDLKKLEDRIRKRRARDRDSRLEDGDHKRQKSSSGRDRRNLSQSPSRTPPDSPFIPSDDDQRSPSIDEGLTVDTIEVALGGEVASTSNHSHDPPVGTSTAPAEASIEHQPTVKPGGDSSSLNAQKTEASGQENELIIEDLDEEILDVIGKRVAEDRVLAPAIPKSIAVRLEDILKKGLPKEEREKLIKEHAPPKNCVLIDPPKLNEEVKVSIAEPSRKRDDRIVDKQKKITACLALMGSSIVDVINNSKADKGTSILPPAQIALVKKLSEAARLLADLQRDETLTRRSLILATINSSQKEVLESSTADEWLFGQKLDERLKAAKTIERSGKDLKAKPKISKKPKNFKTPPRRQPFKPRTSGGFRNKFYNQNQSNKKNWGTQNTGDHNPQSQTPAQQKKA
ncbi:uncharacterized protein LOC112458126 [Temnothorax curvispinosus]|uniref:Uncharacterized protein LOC112458126 n=3 Tax=Temnothorax curvispinosus TaxID=300111 RepID=A0A6J1Q8Z8_9HYME|nr:uncharacterized protein LOC112458126 [Temnothorax curvispinosus]